MATLGRVDVRMLGRLRVDDGVPVRIEAPKQRALFEVLAAFADSDVSPDTLIDAIWGDAPPPTAAKSLHSHVSRLRSVLPDGAIVTDGQAYRLDIDPDDVDLHRFERLVGAARQAVDGDEPARSLELVDAAIDLWRGRPLEDLADGAIRAGHVARLEELLSTARELRLAALLGLGREEQVIVDADELIAEHPLREPAWAHLLLRRTAPVVERKRSTPTVACAECSVRNSGSVRQLDCASWSR